MPLSVELARKRKIIEKYLCRLDTKLDSALLPGDANA
jgi:hypothetical protein